MLTRVRNTIRYIESMANKLSAPQLCCHCSEGFNKGLQDDVKQKK